MRWSLEIVLLRLDLWRQNVPVFIYIYIYFYFWHWLLGCRTVTSAWLSMMDETWRSRLRFLWCEGGAVHVVIKNTMWYYSSSHVVLQQFPPLFVQTDVCETELTRSLSPSLIESACSPLTSCWRCRSIDWISSPPPLRLLPFSSFWQIIFWRSGIWTFSFLKKRQEKDCELVKHLYQWHQPGGTMVNHQQHREVKIQHFYTLPFHELLQ